MIKDQLRTVPIHPLIDNGYVIIIMDNYYRTDISPIISNNSICDGREDEDLADNCIIYFLENNFYDIKYNK